MELRADADAQVVLKALPAMEAPSLEHVNSDK